MVKIQKVYGSEILDSRGNPYRQRYSAADGRLHGYGGLSLRRVHRKV